MMMVFSPLSFLGSNSAQRFRGTNYRYKSSSHMLRFPCSLHLFFLYLSLAHCSFFTFIPNSLPHPPNIHDTFFAFSVLFYDSFGLGS